MLSQNFEGGGEEEKGEGTEDVKLCQRGEKHSESADTEFLLF